MKGPDTDARTGAIEAHLPLVRSIARRYAGRGEPLDDLVQAGTVGLIKAVDTWDPDRGRDLAALARPAIEGEIRHHLRDGGSGPHVARGDRELGARLRALRTDLTARLHRAPTTAELADAAGVDPAHAERALDAGAGAVALSDDEAARLPSGAPGTEAAEARVLLEAGWDVLDERERRLLELRYRDDRSQSEIARELGLSQAHVSRLLKAALERLRAAVAPEESSGAADAPVTPRATTAADERSGRLLLRLPRTLHTDLADAAEREGVPLNTYISAALAAHVADPREAAAAARRHRLLVLNALVIGAAAVVGLVLLLTALL
ncbi:sigma-70 family RNA polymerase sigma factor [Conexibacter woesei]|uniref:sigma-70 family RNA polymerase sigma factor n=1 Tax=Conexibacter woesei TaxID=191495 RepID=UPI00041ECC48|nr:sigma-70 family RNA polymerase sigma factor [Conexibacter woesei]